ARHDGNIGGRFNGMPLVHASAHARVLAFRIFTNDDPVQIFDGATFQWCINTWKDTGGPHVGILIKALADLKAQSPEGDVVGNIGISGRTEYNRVFVTQGVQPIFGHHDAMLAIEISTPIEVFKFERERGVRLRERLQQFLAGGYDFLAYAVSGYRGNPICF